MVKRLKKITYNISQVNKSLKIIIIISIVSILIMDLFLNEIQAPFKILHVLGIIYYNICLAYISSFVFYIVTIFMPQQRKKVAMYVYFNNRIAAIETLESDLFNVIVNGSILCSTNAKKDIKTLQEDKLKASCEIINMYQSVSLVSSMGSGTFKNWFKLINHIHSKVKINIDELLIFQDCISIKVIRLLTTVENRFTQGFDGMEEKFRDNGCMSNYLSELWYIHKDTQDLINTFRKEYSKLFLYHREMCKVENSPL